MAGREKQKQYQYSKEGKFLKEYESLAKVLEKYNKSKGNFYGEKSYRLMEDETIICQNRPGREAIKRIYRIENCPFCNTLNKNSKIIEVYNLLGRKIAEFESLELVCKMTGVDQSTVFSRATKGNKTLTKNGNDLIYKYKV